MNRIPVTRDEPSIQIALSDVRCADDIRITFDFPRNGWVVEQCTHDADLSWVEAAFVRAWGSENSFVKPPPAPILATQIPCPDCYGGHFRPCQVCGDSGWVSFTPNAATLSPKP